MPWDEAGIWVRDPLAQPGMVLLGAALKRRRLKLGLSQTRLERMTGIDQTTISRFENGKRCGLRWWRFAVLVAVLGGLDFGDLSGIGAYGRRRPVNPYLAARALAEAEDEDEDDVA
ncbi:MAG: helix-turn-helix domain-containing protein [Candidatus Limnocylindrales bacterium]